MTMALIGGSIPNGRYIAAARHLVGMTQLELANAACLHVNSLKRQEQSDRRVGGYAVGRLIDVLAEKGIEVRDGIIIVRKQ